MSSADIDFAALARELLAHADELVPAWLPSGKRSGREWVCGDLAGEPGRSTSVNLDTGRWADFAGAGKGGDLISLYAAIHGIKQIEAARRLGGKPETARPNGHANLGPAAPAAEKAPSDADLPTMRGTTARWVYTDRAGSPLLVVCRIDTPGGKSFCQFTWRGGEWKAKGLDGPRPLYRLAELAARPTLPVLLVEGEKAADAAQAALGASHTVTTWPGGAKAWNRADFSPLTGRSVTIWPDADEPGLTAAQGIADLLLPIAASVAIVPTADFPPRWDAADVPPLEIWGHISMAVPAPKEVPRETEPLDTEQIPIEAYADEDGSPVSDDLPRAACTPNPEPEPPVTLEDFWAYMPQHTYIYVPTREMWPAPSVNSRVPPVLDPATEKLVKPSHWLDQTRAIEQMTWGPGLPIVIENRLIADGGWFERAGARTFNLYRPPAPTPGDGREAGPWLAHLRRIYPSEADHIVRWLAHRVQHPEIKLNHALVLGGAEGIGKDTILEPVKYAVGAWNFAEVTPIQLLGRFNGFVKSVILRMSEARDLGDVDRYALHEHLKPLIAAPPDVLRCDEKNLREHAVVNVCGVVITTNHTDGLYIPPDSRRYFVAWSDTTRDDTDGRYWTDLYYWFERENGYGHVAAYLRELDLADWNPKAPPSKTPAFWRVVDAGRAPEDSELADALDAVQRPQAVTVSQLCIYASDAFREWLQDRRNARQLPHRMEAAGYIAARNDSSKDGQWVVAGKRQTVYTKRELPVRDRITAALALVSSSRG